ncbi:tomoregulin-2a [Lepisosteus oculatus]|uniref:Transmembrane protein with EGF-like and two follistatin-like domains 2b n=1 Tax=Lepisosteus oculatus TaxID=7918 RepID=W5MCN0_LEPOC|nr:PREDICTED: tomoregulin-2 [Lepisosteus oculatus]
MGFSATALQEPRRRQQWNRRTLGDRVFIALVTFITTLPVHQLRAFPTSLSDCQTPTGWNCSGYDDRDTDLFLCDTNTCKFDGECLRIGDTVTCVCEFKCNNDYVPVCGSNNENYQNECYLRKDACKQQTEVLVVSEGSCPVDAGSGSGDDGGEGSGETNQKEPSTCDICQFGAECDEDAEDVWCVCNIDCSHISFNPVCASDGKSYDNPCQVKEASCQKQERIEVKYLGRCQDDMTTGAKTGDGHYARTDYTEENTNKLEEAARGLYIPCPEHYKNYCVHGNCEYPSGMLPPSCRCDSGFSGPQCDTKEYNVLYVVPGSGKLRYVLIASIIGAVQVAIICVVVLCITRKCPRSNRINRQKQNATHYSSENTMRASTRLI